MAVRTDKSVIYHIPKCGGIWVKEAVRRSGIPYHRCRSNELREEWDLLREHSIPDGTIDEDREGLFGFCFVRRPVGWYRSFWCFRMKGLRAGGSLAPKFPADKSWSDDPEEFAHNLMDAFPNGFVGKLYRRYVGGVDYVGRQESLREDLLEALTLAGETFNPEVVRTLKRFNRVASRPEWRQECVLGQEVQERIRRVEAWVLETYYV